MLAPYKGRVFDPCCGSGGMFVQSVEFVKAHATGNGNGFIDARKLGTMINRVQRHLTPEDIQKIAGTYHAWRDVAQPSRLRFPAASRRQDERPPNPQTRTSMLPAYQDIPGFCKSAKLEEIRTHGHVLTPGRYVGAADVEDDGEPFEQKMKRLTATLEEQFADSAKLEKAIRQNLKTLNL